MQFVDDLRELECEMNEKKNYKLLKEENEIFLEFVRGIFSLFFA